MEDNQLEGDFPRISAHNAPFLRKTEQNVETPPQDAFIHRIPIEILSSIFIFVKDTYDAGKNEPWYALPRQSTPLAFKAVCKKWWDVTMETPQLWADLILNINAPADVQLSMVNDWGRRSGALALNLTIFLADSYLSHERNILAQSEEIIKTLRSFAVRWNHLFLRVPWSYSHNLLHGLEETSSLRSLYHIPMMHEFGAYLPIQLSPPFCLKRFHSMSGGIIPIPFVWNDLVHLEVNGINKGEFLDIVRHASSLKHCETQMIYHVEDERYRVPTTPITNHSLIHLRTNHEGLGLLTLPSLQYLEYFTKRPDVPGYIEPLVGFIDRSSPPLQTLIFRSESWPRELNPCFKKLSTIRHLSIGVHGSAEDYESTNNFFRTITDTSSKVILPNLQEFKLDFPFLPPSSWSLLSRLFRNKDQTILPRRRDGMATSSDLTFGRPLSQVHIYVSGDGLEDETDKDPFLRLLTVKTVEKDLYLTLMDSNSESHRNLWGRMAKFCGVSL